MDCKITGTETYDTDAQATVVEVRNKNKLTHRYWVDSSKGFICPRIQIYNNDVLLEEYQSKDFVLHSETGFWFPTSYQIARYDNDSNLRFQQEYSINKESIKINQAVSDNEFSIDIPVNLFVDDVRTGTVIRFQAVDKGELSLAKSGLDLDKCQWLQRIIPPTDVNTIPQGGVSGTTRIILVAAGLVLILLALLYRTRLKFLF